MEEEEIELWYEEQKQKLSELYIKSIEKGVKIEEREKKFNKAMEKLNLQYEKKHVNFNKQKETQKKREKLKGTIFGPFASVGFFFIDCLGFIGKAIRGVFKAKCASTYFRASLVWIKNAHKVSVGFANAFRPLYYWYVKHLQRHVIAFVRPFIKLGRFFKKKKLQIGEFFAKTGSAFWKYIKTAVKFTAKHSAAACKNISSKLKEKSKNYQDWQAKRIQAHLDKKHHKQEEKKKKGKEKEEATEPQAAEGQAATHPGEAPDAESTAA